MARKKLNKLHKDRQAENRAVVRFLMKGMGGLIVIALFVWGVLELQNAQTLPIKNVQVKSEFIRITEQQIQVIVAQNDLGGFFDTDVKAITKSMRQLPWLETVTVRRIWPDTLQLEIRERKAMAYWNNSGLLTFDGIVFKPNVESYPAGLPHLSGPVGTEKNVLKNYITLNAELKMLNLSINELTLDKRRAWSAHLANGTVLDLGRKQVNERMQRFISIYKDYIATQQNEIEVVDLRYTNGFAVRWKKTLKKVASKAQLG